MADQPVQFERSYGCTFGCGNPYDVIVVSVADSTTELLCMPCFIRMAVDLAEAITSPDSDAVKAALALAPLVPPVSMNGPGPRKGRRNAPATAADPDILAAYDDVITADELPEDFR